MKFKIGDEVEKATGGYRFKGTVVAVFRKLNQVERCVVENSDGMLFIFKELQLEYRGRQDD